MLLALAQWLSQDIRTFSVLNYIHTARGACRDDRPVHLLPGRAGDDT